MPLELCFKRGASIFKKIDRRSFLRWLLNLKLYIIHADTLAILDTEKAGVFQIHISNTFQLYNDIYILQYIDIVKRYTKY